MQPLLSVLILHGRIQPTLLSSQHFEGIKNRLEPFGFKVAKLDGRTSTKDRNALKKSLEDGTIDLVVGTHALLNVKCKNLGLVVVDEEHKFGVKQKEKLKDIRSDVHIFSMSATPIPRTLNLAMSKIKGMSSLLTPPSERLGVRSFVKEYDDKLIKEIILREKQRIKPSANIIVGLFCRSLCLNKGIIVLSGNSIYISVDMNISTTMLFGNVSQS